MDEKATVVTVLGAGLAAVSGVVGVLWRKVEKNSETLEAHYKQTTLDLLECREDRAKIRAAHDMLKERVEELEDKRNV